MNPVKGDDSSLRRRRTGVEESCELDLDILNSPPKGKGVFSSNAWSDGPIGENSAGARVALGVSRPKLP